MHFARGPGSAKKEGKSPRRRAPERGRAVKRRVNSNSTKGLFRTARFLGLAGALVLSVAVASGSERWETLEAIHCVENPQNVTRPGLYGELGAYQFRESTWRQHTSAPFARALEREVSDVVAVRHYEYLRRGLERAGLPVTCYNIALAWNAGLAAAVRGRSPAATRDYAERVANIAGTLHRPALVASAR